MNGEDKKSSFTKDITDLFTYDNAIIVGEISALSIIVIGGTYWLYQRYQSEKSKKDYENVLKETSKKYKHLDYN